MINSYVETFNKYKDFLLTGFLETFEMLIVAIFFTVLLGFVFGFTLFVTKKDSLYENKYIYNILSTILNVIRSIPFILLIIVLMPVYRFFLGVGFGVNASKIPLSIIGVAIYSKLIEQTFIDLKSTTFETSYALGANRFQFFKLFLLKESRSTLIAHLTSTIISLIAYSTVMGTIGGGGLGDLAINEGYINYNYRLMWIAIVILIIIVQIIQTAGNIIAQKLDKK